MVQKSKSCHGIHSIYYFTGIIENESFKKFLLFSLKSETLNIENGKIFLLRIFNPLDEDIEIDISIYHAEGDETNKNNINCDLKLLCQSSKLFISAVDGIFL